MKYAALLLCASLLGCSMVTPMVDTVKESSKPITISLGAWLMTTLVNPIAGAVTAGATILMWDMGVAKEETEEAEAETKVVEKEKEQLGRDTIAALIDGKTEHLTRESDWQSKLMMWFIILYAAKQVLFSRFTPRILRKIKLLRSE